IWAGAVVSALALTFAGVGAGQASAADVNNARNAGFEAGLSNWTCSANSGTTVSSPVHGGTAALQATPAGQDNAPCSQTVPVKPNPTYQLSGWARGGYAYLGPPRTGTTDVSTWTPDSAAWKQLSTSFTTGSGTSSVTVYTHGWYGQQPYYADDLSVFGPDAGGGDGEPEPTVPGTPGGLAVSGTTASSVSLSWNPVSRATGYTLYRDGTKVSAAVTARTKDQDGGGGGDLPRHAVTGYWQNFDNGAAVQRISDVQDQYDIIAVAFADATGTPGAVTFNLDTAGLNGYTVAQFKADVRAKQAAGKKVIISVGGEKGTVSVNDAASATNFANSVYAVMQEYGFDGVDIDLENGLNATYM